jgi:hypothetical protein
MREITDHVVEGDDAPQLVITALDEPGPGGANHKYSIRWKNDRDQTEPHCYIGFQNGPIKEVGMNGVQSVALLAVIIDQLTAWQAGPFASPYNAVALESLEAALDALKQRTRDRIKRGVEGNLLA